MEVRTRLLAVAGAMAITGGMIATATSPAGAAVTPTGTCVGAVTLTKLTPALTDQTQEVKAAGAVTTNSVSTAKNGGACFNTVIDPGNGKVPSPPPATLTPKAVASLLTGSTSCAQGSSAQAADANRANAYTLSGKITYTMNQTYTEITTGIVKPWKLQAFISVLGFSASAGPDVIDVSGMVILGASTGSNISGSLWEDPSNKSVKPDTGYQNSGYTPLDALSAINALGGCADAVPNNVQMPGAAAGSGIPQVLVGDGSSPTFGSNATGLAFQMGE